MHLTWFFLGVAVVLATFLLDESEAHGGWTRIFKPKVRKPSSFRVSGNSLKIISVNGIFEINIFGYFLESNLK